MPLLLPLRAPRMLPLAALLLMLTLTSSNSRANGCSYLKHQRIHPQPTDACIAPTDAPTNASTLHPPILLLLVAPSLLVSGGRFIACWGIESVNARLTASIILANDRSRHARIPCSSWCLAILFTVVFVPTQHRSPLPPLLHRSHH
jgi:hypothetical protein